MPGHDENRDERPNSTHGGDVPVRDENRDVLLEVRKWFETVRPRLALPLRVRAAMAQSPTAVVVTAAASGLVVGWAVLGALWPPPWARGGAAAGFGRLPGAIAIGVAVAVTAYGVAVLGPRIRATSRRSRRSRLADEVGGVRQSVSVGAGEISPRPIRPAGEPRPPTQPTPPTPDTGSRRAVPPFAVPPMDVPRVAPGVAPPLTVPADARWKPEQVHVGRTLSVRYLGPDVRFYRTWLVYDDEGGLLGGAGLRARRNDEVETLELWFFERDDEPEPAQPPIVVLATPLAAARADDASEAAGPVLPAVAGRHFTLETGSLVLRALVVESTPDASGLAFRTLTLDLCATQKHADKA